MFPTLVRCILIVGGGRGGDKRLLGILLSSNPSRSLFFLFLLLVLLILFSFIEVLFIASNAISTTYVVTRQRPSRDRDAPPSIPRVFLMDLRAAENQDLVRDKARSCLFEDTPRVA